MSAVVRRMPLFVFAILAVFAAILCIAAIHDRVATRPEAAINLVRKIEAAEESYRSRFGWYASNIGELSSAGMVGPELFEAGFTDYQFELAGCRNGGGYMIRFGLRGSPAREVERVGCGAGEEGRIKLIDSPMGRPGTATPTIPGRER